MDPPPMGPSPMNIRLTAPVSLLLALFKVKLDPMVDPISRGSCEALLDSVALVTRRARHSVFFSAGNSKLWSSTMLR
jgi:hypothetical protein